MISYQPIKPNSIIINEFDNFLDPRPEVQYFVPFQDFDKWDFPQEEVSKTLSYHFFGIMSIIKPGKEVEDVKPQLKNYERP